MSSLVFPQTDITFAPSQDDGRVGWKTLVSRAFPLLRVNFSSDKPFYGQFRAAGTPNFSFFHLSGAEHEIEQRPQDPSTRLDPILKISLHLGGHSTFRQGQREINLKPGDLAIYDTSRPYSMSHDEGLSFLVAMFRRSDVAAIAPDAQELAGTKIDGDTGLGRMLSGFLYGLDESINVLTEPSSTRLSKIGLELISTFLATNTDASIGRSTHSQLRDIYAYIEENLDDPELSPDSIATSHFMSVRALHNLFEDQDHTVASLIRRRRLERAAANLQDPLLAERSIANIAEATGFTDAGYFSKVFKSVYGVTPSQARTQR